MVAVDDGVEVPGKLQVMLEHVEYILHPTFESPQRESHDEPYLLCEKGWGEFDLQIMLHFIDEFAAPELIHFDLKLDDSHYSRTFTMVFRDLTPESSTYLVSLEDIGSNNDLTQDKEEDQLVYSPTCSLSSSTSSPSSIYLTPEAILSPEPDDNNDDRVMDKVMVESDIQYLDAIHSIPHGQDTCLAWDIPDRFDMVELTRRLTLLSQPQVAALYAIIQMYQNNTMMVSEMDNELTMDLYSLGTPLLTRLWDFTETVLGQRMADVV
ncbi:hypothetical protein BC941DRAFT_468471 [Chlamydoabsidia padenii]|nr:hypothetical protein BC941DRAFT_468471 [Chlamydoabsidia padenii]